MPWPLICKWSLRDRQPLNPSACREVPWRSDALAPDVGVRRGHEREHARGGEQQAECLARRRISPSRMKVAPSDSTGIDGTTMAVVRPRSRRAIAAYHTMVPRYASTFPAKPGAATRGGAPRARSTSRRARATPVRASARRTHSARPSAPAATHRPDPAARPDARAASRAGSRGSARRARRRQLVRAECQGEPRQQDRNRDDSARRRSMPESEPRADQRIDRLDLQAERRLDGAGPTRAGIEQEKRHRRASAPTSAKHGPVSRAINMRSSPRATSTARAKTAAKRLVTVATRSGSARTLVSRATAARRRRSGRRAGEDEPGAFRAVTRRRRAPTSEMGTFMRNDAARGVRGHVHTVLCKPAATCTTSSSRSRTSARFSRAGTVWGRRRVHLGRERAGAPHSRSPDPRAARPEDPPASPHRAARQPSFF